MLAIKIVMNNLVSIITPSYNSSKFIEETIQSVLAQTYTEWELLITDDCSTDKTVEIVERYVAQDSRIKLFVLEQNSGAATARNNSLAKAKGKYIAFLDSDDLWYPQKLAKQLSYMEEHNCAFTFSNYALINENGLDINKIIRVPKKVTYHRYLRNTIIGCLTVMIDKEKVGDFYMPNIPTSQDMATWLSIMKKGVVAYGIPKVLAQYRLVEHSNSAKKIKASRDVWRVYRDIEHLPYVYALFCFFGYAINAIVKRL